MDVELLDQIAAHASTHEELSLLRPDEAEHWRRLVARRFDFPEDRTWWWECVARDARSVEYGQNDGLERLRKLLPHGDPRVVLFVTDDDPPPWPCVAGPLDALVGLLRSHRFFEYFIVPTDLAWIVFDTHENRLIAAGLGSSSGPT